MNHYLIPASINDSPKPISQIQARARKRGMNTINLTFGQLKEKMASALASKNDASQSYANLLSALNNFMSQFDLSDRNAVGSVLRLSFYKNCQAHINALVEQGKSSSYIANRKSYLTRWHRLMLVIDREYAETAGTATPLATALKELLPKHVSVKQVAAETKVGEESLRRWIRGKKPTTRAIPSLRRLEHFFGLTPNELISLAGLSSASTPGACDTNMPSIRYRERLGKQAKEPYALKEIGSRLREEWSALVHYKTALTNFDKARQNNGRWGTTSEKLVRQTEKNWYTFSGKNVVPTAGIEWMHVSQFLGWLALSPQRGGLGVAPAMVQSIAHLTNCVYLSRYIEWRIERAGQQINGSVIRLLQFVKSLCHPETGYFCHTPELSDGIGVDALAWNQRCTAAFQFAKRNLGSLLSQSERTRDPFEPLQSILQLSNPLDAVADAIQRLNAARPSTGGEAEAIWARDRLLLKLLSSNPIRAKNLKGLKIGANAKASLVGGDTGVIYRANDGGWRITIPRKFFKNHAGAARERDYDMPVEASVWPDIDNYLSHYRPLLASSDNPYLFTSSVCGQTPERMYSLNRRVAYLTRRYFWRCPGFGPHGFRHILATAILKLSPNDWQTAALVLHDRVETVQQHYAHLRSTDGAERQFSILASSYARM
jgi:integrase